MPCSIWDGVLKKVCYLLTKGRRGSGDEEEEEKGTKRVGWLYLLTRGEGQLAWIVSFFLAWQSKDGIQRDLESEVVRKTREKKEGLRATRDRLSRELEFWKSKKERRRCDSCSRERDGGKNNGRSSPRAEKNNRTEK